MTPMMRMRVRTKTTPLSLLMISIFCDREQENERGEYNKTLRLFGVGVVGAFFPCSCNKKKVRQTTETGAKLLQFVACANSFHHTWMVVWLFFLPL